MWVCAFIFIGCALLFWTYWTIWGQFSESTDDAYVNGNMIMITPQVGGIITSILADNTQVVEAGQPLVTLDRSDNEIAFERAKADLADSVRMVAQLFIKVEELRAKQLVKEADFTRASLDFDHRAVLVIDGSVSIEDYQHSETTLFGSYAALVEVEREFEAALAEVENTTLVTHPKVELAKSNLRATFLALHRCTVLAPTRGIITQRKAQVGQLVVANESIMALVPADQMWVDANLREVSLKNLRIGQPVEIETDMYGRDVIYHGEVVGLNPGTGSIFSILPPQNATGNWIKIVQRIPVKISINPLELKLHPLVLGLSTTVTIDTHNRTGLQLPNASCARPLYCSPAYMDELDGTEEIINQIIAENSPRYE